MIFLKTSDEIELLRQANLLVGKALAEVANIIEPGVTTRQLDKVAEEFIRDNGAIPTFKGYPNHEGTPFPGSICASVNDVVVHGIPNDIPLKEGDIVSVDCGTLLNGFCGDSCYTFCVGEVDEATKLLLQITKESLYKGIEQAVHGNVSVISVVQCRPIASRTVTVLYVNLWATVLVETCTSRPRFQIMDARVTGCS